VKKQKIRNQVRIQSPEHPKPAPRVRGNLADLGQKCNGSLSGLFLTGQHAGNKVVIETYEPNAAGSRQICSAVRRQTCPDFARKLAIGNSCMTATSRTKAISSPAENALLGERSR
jgi:hypothetical protein